MDVSPSTHWGTQVAFSADLCNHTPTALRGYRATRKALCKANGTSQKTSRGKAACYYSYPLAILIDDTQLLAKFVTVRDLDLLLHHLVERFRCVIPSIAE